MSYPVGIMTGSDGRLWVIRCPECGKENFAPCLPTGTCAWCSYDPNEEEPMTDKEAMDRIQAIIPEMKVNMTKLTGDALVLTYVAKALEEMRAIRDEIRRTKLTGDAVEK